MFDAGDPWLRGVYDQNILMRSSFQPRRPNRPGLIGSMAKASPSPPNASHLDFLCAVFRDASQPVSRRMRAAAQVAPFVHLKLFGDGGRRLRLCLPARRCDRPNEQNEADRDHASEGRAAICRSGANTAIGSNDQTTPGLAPGATEAHRQYSVEHVSKSRPTAKEP